MKKISNILIVIVAISIIISMALVSSLLISSNLKVIKVQAVEHLELSAVQKGQQLEISLQKIATQMDELANTTASHLDSGLLSTLDNQEQLDELMAHIAPIFKKSASSVKNNVRSYLIFNIDYTKRISQLVFTASDSTLSTYVMQEQLVTKEQLQTQPEKHDWYYRPLELGRGVWSDPFYDSELKVYLITYSTPIIIDGLVVGVIGTDMHFDSFKDLVENVDIYQTGYAFLFNENFDYLVHPLFTQEENLMTVENGTFSYMKPIFETKDTGTIEYLFFEEDKIMGFYHLKNGWILAVAPTIKEVFESFYETRDLSVIIALVGILITILVTSFVSHKLTSPVNEIMQYVKIIGDGNLDHELPYSLEKNRTDLGMLATSIDKMRIYLQDAFEQNEQQKNLLETNVTLRTQELQDTNDELQVTLETLAHTQSKLLRSEKDAAVKVLIQNLAHRLNTPLGTAITTSSFLLGKLSELDSMKDAPVNDTTREVLYDSIVLINSCLASMKDSLDNLRVLLDTYDNPYMEHIKVNNQIQSYILNMSMLHPESKTKFSQKIDDEEIEIYHAPSVFDKLIGLLCNYSVQLNKNNIENQVSFEVTRSKNELLITFSDPLIEFDANIDRMFEPYFNTAHQTKSIGLELLIISDVVTRGLLGSIHASRNGDNTIKIHIAIPIIDIKK
ncbi:MULTISPECIES: cache domain-containing protein [unclassified Fusibacter]|uniref:cache domain-containing protein n=1 Tax=unclassified Fusibacter TaxID=2624464 RepID=UPI0013E96D83|nr:MULTISPECIES: cache domain-containing protein [unclassified Fusibacter]MCK8061508.1 Cache 3/Cache 2 fusion domain-containing protein [Fusibacter sp. A2]NPE23693.1 hypothetical protein [Fusibacter sp. A1]